MSVFEATMICGGRSCQPTRVRRNKRSFAHLLALPSAREYNALFHAPDPVGKGAVQGKVEHHCDGGPVFGLLEAELVVKGKGDGRDEHGRVAEC